MNTLKVLVADDEAPARNKMVRMLQNFAQVEIINISSNGLDAYNYICQLKPDVAFLDIEMPGMNGLEIIENLPPDINPHIVFATAYNEHAIRAFELNAIDYLLKPFNDERLAQTLEKLDKTVEANPNADKARELADVLAPHLSPSALNKIPVPAGDRFRLLDYDEVVCIEVEDRSTQIYTISKQYSLNLTLEAVEKRLPTDQFLRISRSAIVNIHAIQEIVMWFGNRFKIVLNNGKEVVTSRERAKHVKQMLKF